MFLSLINVSLSLSPLSLSKKKNLLKQKMEIISSYNSKDRAWFQTELGLSLKHSHLDIFSLSISQLYFLYIVFKKS